jgi:ADP-glucose pyrophosphorylase
VLSTRVSIGSRSTIRGSVIMEDVEVGEKYNPL